MIEIWEYKHKNVSLLQGKKIHSIRSPNRNLKYWVILNSPTHDDLAFVKEKFKLHPTTLEDISLSVTRTKYEEFDNYTLIVFKGIEEFKNGQIKTYTIHFIDGNNFLITVCHKNSDTINALRTNKKKLGLLMKKGEDFVLHQIIDLEVDKFLDTRDKVIGRISKIENIIKVPSKNELNSLFRSELIISKFKRVVESTLEVIARLTKPTENYIDNTTIPYFRDVYDHLVRVDTSLMNVTDRIYSIRNVYLSITSNHMNETIRMLTILMTVMMPLTIITGFFGMNVKLPGQDYMFMYVIVIVMMGIIGYILYLILRFTKLV